MSGILTWAALITVSGGSLLVAVLYLRELASGPAEGEGGESTLE